MICQGTSYTSALHKIRGLTPAQRRQISTQITNLVAGERRRSQTQKLAEAKKEEETNTLRDFLGQNYELETLRKNIKNLDDFLQEEKNRPQANERIDDYFDRIPADNPLFKNSHECNKPLTRLQNSFRRVNSTFAEMHSSLKIRLDPKSGLHLTNEGLRFKGLGSAGLIMLAKIFAYIPNSEGKLGKFSLLPEEIKSRLKGNW